MALAKLQTAAILAAATLLILIPATLLAVHHHVETTSISAAPPASQPTAEDPNAPYVLPSGRVLINIPDPPKEPHDQLQPLQDRNPGISARAISSLKPPARATSNQRLDRPVMVRPRRSERIRTPLSLPGPRSRPLRRVQAMAHRRRPALPRPTPPPSNTSPMSKPFLRDDNLHLSVHHRSPRRVTAEVDRLPRPMEIHPRSRRTTVSRKVPTIPVV